MFRPDSRRVLLLSQKEEARKFGLAGGFDDSGSLPEGYSSFVGRCPAACRRAILLSSEDVRQLAGGLFFFRRKMSGSLPEGYSSFVGRCPAACRRAILLSSEDVRQLAGGLFFFRRRKKNQERRHPFERVDDDLGALPPRPPPTIDGRPSHSPLLPALPCRPGETLPLPAARYALFR